MSNPFLNIQNIDKSFNNSLFFNDINFSVNKGDIVSILGNSGSGKSTLLSLIAGFITPDFGNFHLESKNITNIPTHKRNIGFLFQNYALFPHLNVFENISFGLKIQNLSKRKIKIRVQEMMEFVNMTGFEFRDVISLSGGEKQRIALARTLITKPNLILFDEPLSALDKNLRESLLVDLSELLKIENITALYVTHDQEEAFSISDKVLILNNGVIQQYSTPIEIINNPNNSIVANFLGYKNLFSIKKLPIFSLEKINIPEKTSYFLIHPNKFNLSNKGPIKLSGTISNVIVKRNWSEITISVANELIVIELPNTIKLPNVKENITLSSNEDNAIQFLKL